MKPEAFAQPNLEPSHSKTLLISGASGLIGTAFTAAARKKGHEVRHLVRRSPAAAYEFSFAPERGEVDGRAFEGVDAVINLSGASISKMPWTRRYKELLVRSRLDATNTIVAAINRMDVPPAQLLSGSAVGIYGNHSSDAPLDESANGTGFLADLCRQWEDAALAAEPTTSVTLLRTGLVLSASGGMLPVVSRITKLGGAGRLGSGRQHWPWISLGDYTAALMHLAGLESRSSSAIPGPVNLCVPEAATEEEFMRTLASVLHRPYLLPAPAFALKLLLGDAANELLLANQPAVPKRLLNAGFRFTDVNLRGLLQRELG